LDMARKVQIILRDVSVNEALGVAAALNAGTFVTVCEISDEELLLLCWLLTLWAFRINGGGRTFAKRSEMSAFIM
jgi:hypothetical protein